MSRLIVCLLVLAVALVASTALLSAQNEAFVVIVHPGSEVSGVTKAELSKIFLKRLRTWRNGEVAVPVDQLPESSIRKHFSEQVHGRSVVNIEVHWKRMIFSGRAVPPREFAGDAEIVDFVSKTPGAVGYVSALADRDGVKLLGLQEGK